MWYDKFPVPPHGSLLETLFVLVRLERSQTQLLETRALVQSIVGLHESKKTMDPAISAYQEFTAKMFPFLDRAMNQEKDQLNQRLENFVAHPARIKLDSYYKLMAEHAGKASNRKRFKLTAKPPGTV